MKDLPRALGTRAVGLLTLALGAASGCADVGAAQDIAARGAAIETASSGPGCDATYRFLANDLGAPHSVAAQYEGYREFLFEVPWQAEVQAIALRPIVDNTKVVHHFTLYDDKSAHLAHWAPGAVATVLPEDVGIYLPAKGRFKLEIHYYNHARDAQPQDDQSGFEVCITRTKRRHTAGMFPFTATANAPAGRVTENVSTCRVSAPTEVHVIAHAPHMHKLGTHARLEVLRADGTLELLHDRAFAFDDQRDYPLALLLRDGDRVRTTCVYDNPGTRDVTFGPSSDDEMCFDFVTYYPRCSLHCTSGDPLIDTLTRSQEGDCAGHAHAGPSLLPAAP